MIAFIWYSYDNEKFKLRERKIVNNLTYNQIKDLFFKNEIFGKDLEDSENIPDINHELIDHSEYDKMGYSLICRNGLNKHLYIKI